MSQTYKPRSPLFGVHPDLPTDQNAHHRPTTSTGAAAVAAAAGRHSPPEERRTFNAQNKPTCQVAEVGQDGAEDRRSRKPVGHHAPARAVRYPGAGQGYLDTGRSGDASRRTGWVCVGGGGRNGEVRRRTSILTLKKKCRKGNTGRGEAEGGRGDLATKKRNTQPHTLDFWGDAILAAATLYV